MNHSPRCDLPSRSHWPRHSGLLLHISSLPGPGGLGDLGLAAHHFLSLLEAAGQRAWQVLPVGPTGFGDSPYQTSSSLGGHPLFVSIDGLVRLGLLPAEVLSLAPKEHPQADFVAAQNYKWPLLKEAHHTLQESNHHRSLRDDLQKFIYDEADWLTDFALFMAIKEEQEYRPWTQWPLPLRDRIPSALAEARARLAETFSLHCFVQWQFQRQWQTLRDSAHAKGIELIGDVPIFVAHDSVEVWCDRSQFLLHPDGALRVMAGVPPDYFSKTGQLWGNPLYDWDRMRTDGFSFWRRRIRRAAALFDRVRIDHFRGFVAHWEIPAADKTAEFGRWVPAPGHELFLALTTGQDTCGVRFVAEDLGIITHEV